jgi:hypothetical protein
MESTKRKVPVVFCLANVIKSDAKTINPMATKEAHILSKPLIYSYSPILLYVVK